LGETAYSPTAESIFGFRRGASGLSWCCAWSLGDGSLEPRFARQAWRGAWWRRRKHCGLRAC